MRAILDDFEGVTKANFDVFIETFTEKFPACSDNDVEIDAQTQLKTLSQIKDETLSSYYNRAIEILQRLDVKDQSRIQERTMSTPETFVLSGVFSAFVAGL
jgi:hypothetical protein